jgi:uncharacterized Zn-binding protein involved in type VI secretion
MAEAAARLHDPISHSPTFGLLVAGAVIGGALATLAVLTAPVSVPVLIGGAMIAGGAVAGAGIGEFVGSLSFARSIQGEIIAPGSSDVFVNGRAAARAHLDTVDCHQHSAGPVIAQGSDSVFINGQPAARRGDRTACDAVIEKGSPNVFIGGGTRPTDPISPEVPDLVHKAMLVVGLGSAMVLLGPEMALLGLAGGLLGGEAMHAVGGAIFGEGSDGQKILTFGGSIASGLGAARGGAWFNRNYQIRQTGLGMNGGGISITRRPTSRQSALAGAAAPGRNTSPATFGKAASSDYKETFFEAHPDLRGKVVVHHAVEQQVKTRYPGVVRDDEMHSMENLRGIPKEANSDLHLSQIRREWNRFYRDNPSPTKQQLLDKASDIDRRYGSQFNPPR